MESTQVAALRDAIENLINAKLQDVLSKPNGLQGPLELHFKNRIGFAGALVLANRQSGVASPDIRDAGKRLEQALADYIDSASRPLQEMDA